MQRNPARTFHDYLCQAVTEPNLLASPYSREQRRTISYMNWLRSSLTAEAMDTVSESSVSVILPTYNRAHVVRRAILSVLSQTMQRLQLIIVDDGSEDGTKELVQKFSDSRITFIDLPKNYGHARARNRGLEEAHHPYIAFLDSDDWWDRNFLSIMLHQIEQTDHRFGYSAQRVLRPTGSGSPGKKRSELIRFAPYNASLLENSNYISMISVLIERSLVHDVGGFDEDYRRYADWEFFLRLAEAAPPLGVPVILSHYDQGSEGAVSRSESRQFYLQKLRRDLSLAPLDLEASPQTHRPQSGRIVSLQADCDERDNDKLEVLPGNEGQADIYRLHGLRKSSRHNSVCRFVTIIIPSFGVPEYLRLCLVSILKFTPEGSYNLVVVDNGSGQEVQIVLDEFEQLEQVTIVRNLANLGFTRAVEQGMAIANGECDVVILNNDAVVTPGWLTELSVVAHRYADAGLVAPRQVLLPGSKKLKTHVPGAVSDFEMDTNLSAHHGNVVDPYFDSLMNIIELDFVPFFCVLIRREVIEEIGPISPEMGVHYQSDWIYSDAVRQRAGRRILHTSRSKVYHFAGRSTDEFRVKDPEGFRVMGVEEDWRAVKQSQSRPSPSRR